MQADGVLLREREVFLDDARRAGRSGYLRVRQARDADQAAVVHDTLELAATLHETGDGLLVLHLLGDDEAPCQGIETAGRAAAFFRGLGEEQVTGVLQVRTLVEVPLEAEAEETDAVLADVRLVTLFHEEVLLVHDAVVRQHLDRFRPGGMHGSYSARVNVKSSGSSTLYATVMSASLLMMQPSSTASSGNLLSNVAVFITFLMLFCF